MKRIRHLAFLLTLIFLTTLLTLPAAGEPEAPSAPLPGEITNYLIIAMGDDSDVGDALELSNSEIGADRVVLSTATDAGGCPANGSFPNNVSIFGGGRWKTSTDPDSVDDAAVVFQGVDWSGEVALTSNGGRFQAANSAVFALTGIQGTITDPAEGTSGSVFKSSGTQDCSGATSLALGNGATGNNNFTQLLTDLGEWKTFIEGLPAEGTITEDVPQITVVNGAGGYRTNYDALDTNPTDNIVMIDIDMDSAGDTFDVADTDWIIEGSGNKLIIFRLRDGSNMNVSNASILLGENYGNTRGPLDGELGTIFYSYEEDEGSGDAVFNTGSNTILNGVGWWDFNVIGEGGDTKTNLIFNNSQGCGQFISQKVNLQNARWSGCLGPPVAVELAAFSAEVHNNTVSLQWETASELDNAGFNVYRSATAAFDSASATALNPTLIAAQGSLGHGASYSATDDAVPHGTWHYFLEDIDIYGVSTFHGPVEVTVEQPTSASLVGLAGGGSSSLTLLIALVVLLLVLAGFVAVRQRSTLSSTRRSS